MINRKIAAVSSLIMIVPLTLSMSSLSVYAADGSTATQVISSSTEKADTASAVSSGDSGNGAAAQDTSVKENSQAPAATTAAESSKSSTETVKSGTEAAKTGTATAAATDTTAASTDATATATETTTTTAKESFAAVGNAGTGTFTGITVDGNMSDWDSVSKDEINDGKVNDAAMVFNGDYVYLYLDEVQPNSASWSGVNSNGNFAITTDLNNVMVIQYLNGGSVSAKIGDQQISGIQVSRDYTDSTWHSDDPHYHVEIAIPKSALPYYKNSLSFGYYLGSTFVSGVSNYDGSSGNVSDSGSSSGDTPIKYDDNTYSDWNNYPHTVIQYDTAGTWAGQVDAEGATYTDGSDSYGHVYTTHPEQVTNMNGYEFTEFNIKINDNQTQMVTGVLADSSGNLNWDGHNIKDLSNGTYTFYLFNIGGDHKTTSINSVSSGDTCYGAMTVTVGANKDETEFKIDTSVLAKQYGLSESDIQTIQYQFYRIGTQWLQSAGTSTDPLLGVLICIIPTSALYMYKRKKHPSDFIPAVS